MFRVEILESPGIVRMKQLARLYLYCPDLNKDLELCYRYATLWRQCQTRTELWFKPKKFWSRISIDFAGLPNRSTTYHLLIM